MKERGEERRDEKERRREEKGREGEERKGRGGKSGGTSKYTSHFLFLWILQTLWVGLRKSESGMVTQLL